MKQVDACPLCACDRSAALDSATDTLAPEINRHLPASEEPLPPWINYRRQCTACGFIYLSPRLDDQELSRLYRLWYGYAYRRVMADPSHIQEREREFSRYHMRMLDRVAPERGRLLDVGCGGGLFLRLAGARGWRTSGIELDAQTAAWAREHAGTDDIRSGTLDETLGDGVFDAVTMFDYLEHSGAPGRDLGSVAARLAPGGVILVRVPNAGGWQARFMGPRWLAIISNHLGYFSRGVLENALRNQGLEIVESTAINYRTQHEIARQRWDWLKYRLLPPNRHSAGVTDDDGTAPAATGLAPGAARRWLYSLLIEQVDHIGGWFDGGNNLMVIARKPAPGNLP